MWWLMREKSNKQKDNWNRQTQVVTVEVEEVTEVVDVASLLETTAIANDHTEKTRNT